MDFLSRRGVRTSRVGYGRRQRAAADREWMPGRVDQGTQYAPAWSSRYVLSSTLYVFWSGPGPEDGLGSDKLEGLVEGHDEASHIIDVLPFSPVRPIASLPRHFCLSA